MDTKNVFAALILVCGMFSIIERIQKQNVGNRASSNPVILQSRCPASPENNRPVAPSSVQESVRRLYCGVKSPR